MLSRLLVYYTSIDGLNHDDSIPTRDVGPGIAVKASGKMAALPEASTKSDHSSNVSKVNVETTSLHSNFFL